MNSPLFPSLVCHLYSYEVCSHFARIINHRCNCSFAWYAALFIFLQKTRENAFYLLILTSEVITRAQPFLQGPVHNGIIRTKQVVDFSHLKSGVDPQPWFWADESWNAKNERDVLLMSPPCCSCILKRSPNVASCRETSFNFPPCVAFYFRKKYQCLKCMTRTTDGKRYDWNQSTWNGNASKL